MDCSICTPFVQVSTLRGYISLTWDRASASYRREYVHRWLSRISCCVLNSFLSEISCEFSREVLFIPIWSKASDMLTYGLFDFLLEFLEVSEHFSLLPRRVDPGVPREVVDERHIVPTTIECCHLGWSPHIWMYYIQVTSKILLGMVASVVYRIGRLHICL